ncbi:MAG: Bax inhibitor-1 family protein [Thermoleophilia bacterium]
MSERPEAYGYDRETWDRATAGARAAASGAIFGRVMFLVAVTAAFCAAGAYVGRDLSGAWALGCFIIALLLTLGVSFSRRQGEVGALQMTLLFAVGLFLGLGVGPGLDAYASLSNGGEIIAQAAGATALFMGVLGAIGYTTSRDLSRLGRVSFFALIGLLVFGIVAIFVTIPGGRVIYAVLGLVIFAGLTLFDFWRLRRAGEADVAIIALSIFLDAFNVFLFFLQLLGGGANRD